MLYDDYVCSECGEQREWNELCCTAAKTFDAKLRHNESCLGAKASPPCEPCARRHATLAEVRQLFKRKEE